MQSVWRADFRMIAGLMLVIALAGLLVWRVSTVRELDQLAGRARAEETLMLDRLLSDLQRYRDQAVSLADHPALAALSAAAGEVAGGGSAEAQSLLLSSADKTSAQAIYYVAPDGRVRAASTTQTPDALTGSAYFARALDGALGTGYGYDTVFARRLFVFAAPSFDPLSGRVRGVVVLLVDVEAIESGWRSAGMAMVLLGAHREIYMSNRSELIGLVLPDGGCRLFRGAEVAHDCTVSRAGGRTLWRLGWGPYLPARALPLTEDLPRIGMSALALADVAGARQVAFLQVAVVVAVLTLFALALIWMRARRRVLAFANAELEKRVRERTQALTRSNEALRREVREREEAEAALRKAQADLVQAGKLSALGQMSAGISHELNQPLMAIRQFAENGALFLERGRRDAVADNLDRITRLSARAARIIRNLRAFARNENEPMSRVDLGQVLATAVELTETRMQSAGVVLVWAPPKVPVPVRAGEVRLGQVFVNLINNAIDAMAGQPEKCLTLSLTPGAAPVVQVRDTGPGIADPERLFEPFYTTKEVSDTDGMGLGLSISYGLVQSFGGRIRGENAPGGGAVFTVELDGWREDDGREDDGCDAEESAA